MSKEKISEVTVFKFEIATKPGNVARLRWDLAEFLSTKGFAPNHWYANWKKLEENVWLNIGGSDRGNPTDPVLSVKVMLRDTAPNMPGSDFYTEKVEEFKAYADKKIKPMVLDLLNESRIPYNVL